MVQMVRKLSGDPQLPLLGCPFRPGDIFSVRSSGLSLSLSALSLSLFLYVSPSLSLSLSCSLHLHPTFSSSLSQLLYLVVTATGQRVLCFVSKLPGDLAHRRLLVFGTSVLPAYGMQIKNRVLR